MKTAMQELIDELNILERDGLIQIYKSPVGNDMLENILPFLLKKEKEQIIDAANQKIFGDITFTSSDEVITKGENYYNQTYNQNK